MKRPAVLVLRVLFLVAAASACLAVRAQDAPLAVLESWVGGRWVAELASPDGRKVTLARTYQWSFDQRVLVGRSWAGAGPKPRQTRETVFFWNADAGRIEFQDFIDDGGYGVGFMERRDGAWFMQARIVGNGKHPHWRAWLTQDAEGKRQSVRVQAEQDGKWVEYGVFDYVRQPD